MDYASENYVAPYGVEGRHIDFGSDLVGVGVVLVVLVVVVLGVVTHYLVCTIETTVWPGMFSYHSISSYGAFSGSYQILVTLT